MCSSDLAAASIARGYGIVNTCQVFGRCLRWCVCAGADRLVEDVNKVFAVDVEAPVAHAHVDLQEAAWIRGNDTPGPCSAHIAELSLKDRSACVWLQDVVNPRTSAASSGVAHLDERDSRYLGEQLTWLGADSLAVGEVAQIGRAHV